MALAPATQRICDRPGCGKTLTANGGRFDFTESGPTRVMEPAPAALGADLCHSCKLSLNTWWTAKRRAAAKEGASQ